MLRTGRLWLRPWSLADLDEAIRLWSDPRVMAFLGGVLDRAAVVERLSRELDSQAAHGFQYWRVSAGDAFVGCAGLKRTDVDGSWVLEMGFHLVPEAWGQGYALELGRAIVAHAFDALGVDALYAGHHPQNRGSERVLAKLGFRRLGTRFYPPTGLDHPWYSVTRGGG
jgi:RimJ/RimL family protein N-acetyltransferase